MGLQYGFSHVGFRFLSKPDLVKRSLQHPVRSAANHIQVLAIAGDMPWAIYVQQ
jgi:hypothetical protein